MFVLITSIVFWVDRTPERTKKEWSTTSSIQSQKMATESSSVQSIAPVVPMNPGHYANSLLGAHSPETRETAIPSSPALVSTSPIPIANTESSTPLQPQKEAVSFDGGAPSGNVVIPIVFTDLPKDLKLNSWQKAQLNAIRQAFVDSVGPDPAAPNYMDRWLNAQQQSDLQFWQMFGTQALLNRQMQARIHP